ncbi:MAG: ATP-binding cassette domain-containing protein [Caldithrix sp.]|nr:ATP-binding cassette domain-containing protein [Caldithrix sp.]
MITIEHLIVRYEEQPALDDISLTFAPGKITGVIGPNGAGKSTLIKAAVGILKDVNGQIYYDQQLLFKNRFPIKKQLGYAPEDTELFPYLNGVEFVQLIGTLRPTDNLAGAVDAILNLGGIGDERQDLIMNYSHGMRKKMALAAALIGEPRYILIDEGLNGLDAPTLEGIKQYLRGRADAGCTIVVASHDLALIKTLCDTIVVLNEGQLVGSFSAQEWETIIQDQAADPDRIYEIVSRAK